jgi:3',5'-cyclic AMP phosphodiesterase CpdA
VIKILVFHHHLVSVPFSGRDKDVLEDAGDILDMVLRHRVNLVFMDTDMSGERSGLTTQHW